MGELRVDTVALSQLAVAFRAVAALGIPPISSAATGHAQLDSAISELRTAIDALKSSSDGAFISQADSVDNAAAGYLTTDLGVARAWTPR